MRSAAVALLVALLAPAGAAASEPIRVGYLGPLSGIFAQVGKDMLDGLRIGLEQPPCPAGGRRIVLVEEDTQGNPAVAQAKYRKLVQQDRIDVMAGILLVHIGYGLAQPIAQDRMPSLFVTTPDDLTKRRPTRWIVRSSFSASQPMHALGDHAARHLRYRKVAAVAMDNGFGYEGIGGFQRVFEEQGGHVVQKLWVPLNVLDFAPFLSQVRRDADAVIAVFAGAQAVQFVRQYAQAGLKGKLPLLGAGVVVDEFALEAIGDDALGVVTALPWAPTLATPANQSFMALVETKVRRQPDGFHAFMYSAGRWICHAAGAVGGQVQDRERFLGALRAASESVPDPRGPIRLDEYGNPTQNIYIRRVERVGGRLQNVVVHTYPMVSQFWTYRPDEFLKSSPYDRGYPPVRP